MATAAEYLRAYRDQAGSDADDAIGSVVDFLTVYGLAESAVDVLCDLIDDEGMTRDFASQLKEHGLDIDAVDAGEDDIDPIEDEMG
jgi:hypothetical protein